MVVDGNIKCSFSGSPAGSLELGTCHWTGTLVNKMIGYFIHLGNYDNLDADLLFCNVGELTVGLEGVYSSDCSFNFVIVMFGKFVSFSLDLLKLVTMLHDVQDPCR